jgi:hypothetical protein
VTPDFTAFNRTLVDLALTGLGLYFTALMARAAAGFLRFRRVRPAALLTWPAPRSAQLPYLFALGLLSAGLTLLNAGLGRPLHHVYGLAVMALYFLAVVPLWARVPQGLYREGLWAGNGFLPWAAVARLAFRDAPGPALVVVPHRGRPVCLAVPPAEYGATRRLLADLARDGVLHLEGGILGL